MKYNNFFISVFLVNYNNFCSNSFTFHFIYFNLFIVIFLLRLWENIKRTKEPIFRLIKSLIFDTVLILKHENRETWRVNLPNGDLGNYLTK